MEALRYIGDGMKGFLFVNPITGVRYNQQSQPVPVVYSESEFMAIFGVLKKNYH